MARSAARIRSLQRACELAHDRAFDPRKYELPPNSPALSTPTPPPPNISRKDWLEEHFRAAIQREFARLAQK